MESFTRSLRNGFQTHFGKQRSTSDSYNARQPRTAFGSGGRKRSSRRTVQGRRRLEEHYDTKRVTDFSESEINDIRQIFEFYDIENNKTMDLSELDVALRALGYNPTVEEVEDMKNLMDVDGDTTIDFGEFCMIIEHMKDMKGEYGDLRDSFRCLDGDNQGVVKAEDLLSLLTTHGQEMRLKNINDMIRFADKDNTGTIEYEEFIRAIKQKVESETLSEGMSASTSSTDPNSSLSRGGLRKQNSNVENLSPKRDSTIKLKTKRKDQGQLDVFEGGKRNAERVNSVVKALGGPILLNCAIVLISSNSDCKPRTKRTRWPTVHRVLELKRQKTLSCSQFENMKLEDLSSDDEHTSLLEESSDHFTVGIAETTA